MQREEAGWRWIAHAVCTVPPSTVGSSLSFMWSMVAAALLRVCGGQRRPLPPMVSAASDGEIKAYWEVATKVKA